MARSIVNEDLRLSAQVLAAVQKMGLTNTPQDALQALSEVAIIDQAAHLLIVRLSPTSASTELAPLPARIIADLDRRSGTSDWQGLTLPPEKAAHFQQLDRERPFIVENIQDDPELNDWERSQLSQNQLQAVAAFPLLASATHLGWLVIESAAPRAYSTDELNFLEILTRQLAVILYNQELVAELHQRTETLATERDTLVVLQQITTQLDTAPDIVTLFEALVGFAATIGAQHHAFYLREDVGAEHHHFSGQLSLSQSAVQAIRARLDGLTWLPNLPANPEWLDLVNPADRSRLGAVVLLPQEINYGRATGLFLFAYDHPQPFAAPLRERVQALNTQLSLALENILIQEDARIALAEAQTLVNASRTLSASVELIDVYKAITQVFVGTGVDKCSLLLYDELDAQNLPVRITVADVRGQQLSRLAQEFIGQTLAASQSPYPFIDQATGTGQIQLSSDVSNDERLDEAARTLLDRLGVQAQASIPLYSRGSPLGLIVVEYYAPYTVSERELTLYRTIANQVTIVIEHARQVDETRRRARQIQTGAEISKSASSILNQKTLIDRAVNLIRDGFEAYYVGLFIVDDQGEWAVLRAGTGEAGTAQLAEDHRLRLDELSMIGWCVTHKQARINLDVGPGAVRFENPHLPLTRTEMALPLISRDMVIGAISIQSTRPKAFNQDDITSLQIMADQLANAILNSRLYQTTQQATQELGALLDINRELSASTDLNELLILIVTKATTIVRGDQGTLFLLDQDQLVPRAVVGGFEEETMSLRIPLGAGVTGEAALTRRSVIRQATEPDPDHQIPNTPLLPEALVAVPVLTETRLIGVLLIRRLGLGRPFTDADLRLLEGMAQQAAIAVENANLLNDTQHARQQMENLYRMSRGFATATTAAEVSTLALVHIPKAGFERMLIGLRDDMDDPDNTWIEITAAWDGPGIESDFLHRRYNAASLPLLKHIHSTERIIIEDLTTHPAIDPQSARILRDQFDLRSVALLPIRVGQKVSGWLLAETVSHPKIFSETDLEPLLAVVDQVGITIDRIQKTESLLKAGEQYLAMVDNIPGAVYHGELDEHGGLRYLYISDDIAEITGYPLQSISQDERLMMQHIVHPADRERITRELRRYLDQEVPYRLQYRIIDHKGRIKHISERGRGIYDPQKMVFIIDGIMFDVSDRVTLEQTVQRRAAQFEAIARVGQSASAILDIDRLIDETVEMISETFGLYYAGLFLLDAEQEWAVLRAGSGDAGRRLLAEGHRLRRDENSMVGLATYHGRARIALDVGDEPQRFDNPHLPATRSEIALPLIARNNVIGALDVQSTIENAFTEEDIATFQLMCDQLANVIQNARLFEQTQRQLQHQEALSTVARVASATLDSRRIFQTTVEQLDRIFDLHCCGIFTYDDTYNNLQVVAHSADSGCIGRIVPVRSDWLNETGLTGGRPVVGQAKIPATLMAPEVRASALLPILVSAKFRGFIGLGSADPNRVFDTETLRLGDRFANQVGIALEKAELFLAGKEREQSLLSIHEITMLANSTLESTHILTEASRKLVELFTVNHCAFFIHQGDGTGTVLAEHPELGTLHMTFPLGGAPFERELIETKKAIIVEDVATDPRMGELRDLFLDMSLKSFLILPLVTRNKLIGSFSLDVTTEIRRFSHQEISLAESIANTLAAAIDNAQLFATTQQNLRELNLLYTTTQELIQAKTEQTMFRVFIDKVIELDVDTISVSLLRTDEGEPYLHVQEIWARQDATFQPDDRLPLRDFFLAPLITQPQRFFIQDVSSDERLTPAMRAQLEKLGVHSLVILPLLSQHQPIGTIHITYKNRARQFSPSQLRLFESLVQQLSLTYQNLRLVASIERRYRREQIIREVARKIHAETNVDRVLQTTLTELSKVLDAPSGVARLKSRPTAIAPQTLPPAQSDQNGLASKSDTATRTSQE